VDPGLVEQVLLNLAVNSRDAMHGGGTLIVETDPAHLDEDYLRTHPGVGSGPHVRLTVRDSGCGMDEETLAHLFEPFFTTKEVGKGTGLGMAMVYGLVTQSGGSIDVKSSPGSGTAVHIYFPCVEAPVAPLPAEASGPAPRGTETVLLVEDQEDVRRLTRSTLEEHGYRVIEAGNGAQALQSAQAEKRPLHVLVSDVVMPGLNGRELAELLLKSRPGLRVLYLSGYTEDTVLQHGTLAAGSAFLPKPFSPDTLVRKLRDLLDAPTANQ
jgi:two-component system cell cycle sensor histidine kinase/response regulator CckA